MEIAIFSRTWESDDLNYVFSEMNSLGIYSTQFNLTSAGLPTMPDYIDIERINKIRETAKKYQINLCALSGTFNMIDPNLKQRNEGIKQFEILCKIASMLEIPIITLCTGSKNLKSKWAWDDANNSEEAWNDLIITTKKIIKFAEKYKIILGVEPEVSNVINTAERARKYLDVINSPYLKIVIDGANLFLPSQIAEMEQVLTNAFELLGDDIVLAHAKDLSVGNNINFVAAGAGVLDFGTYVKLLESINYNGPLIAHGLSAKQVPESLKFLKEKLNPK